MDLVNRTPVAASLVVSEVPGEAARAGLVTAKATFVLGPMGPELDRLAPLPLFKRDQETELGLLPRDDLPLTDDLFDVILLGAAYARGGRPVPSRRIALSVGADRRELAVFGDRVWESRPEGKRISAPVPFTRMPIAYSRAFGGSCEVLIDREAPIDVVDPVNPAGRGFDAELRVNSLAQLLKPPPGYPLYQYTRSLPNIEDPGALIGRWDDAPQPAGWATVPLEIGLHALRAMTLRASDGTPEIGPGVFHRAHPTWVIKPPGRGSIVTLDGLTPGDPLSFRLPELRIVADYLAGRRAGTRELSPRCLVLLPEEHRFYIVFQHRFAIFYRPGEERCLRLRLLDGGADRGTASPYARAGRLS